MSISTVGATPSVSGRHSGLAWVLAGLWLISAAAGLWFFELRPLQAASGGTVAAFDGERLARLAGPLVQMAAGKPVALHFRDPHCPCSRFTSEAALDISRRGAGKGVRSFLVSAPGSRVPWGWKAAGISPVDEELARRLWAALPASPALALFDSRGRLVYLGAYGSSGQCRSGTGPAFMAMDRLLADVPAPMAGVLATGCFCAPGSKRIDADLLVTEAGT